MRVFRGVSLLPWVGALVWFGCVTDGAQPPAPSFDGPPSASKGDTSGTLPSRTPDGAPPATTAEDAPPSPTGDATPLLDAAVVMGVEAGSPSAGLPAGKLRLIVETDAPGGDPDDEGSLVRFLMYANEWDIEGILATRAASQSRNGVDGKQTVLKFIAAYEKTYANLKQHKSDYPTPDSLRAVTKASFGGNEGRDLIIAAVDKADSRPIWYANWGTNDGNLTGMRQALDHVQKTRSAAAYKAFIGKIYFSRDADRDYHVQEHIPNIPFWVDTRNPDRWYHRWAPLTGSAGGFDIGRDVKTGHGPLGALYTIQKEGDTPAFMYLLDVGLGDPMHPTWGSWGGRFAPRTDAFSAANPKGFFWSAAQDTWNGSTSRDNTLARWAVHIQNDFRARMDWAVQPRSGANHEPVPVLNGATGRRHVELMAKAGEVVQLSAAQSMDPDGHNLTYQWIPYPEAGSYRGAVTVQAMGANATVQVPSDLKAGDSLHLLLIVTDDGTPPLTRYRRAVVVGR